MNRFLSFLSFGFFFFLSGCSLNSSSESTQPSAAISVYALSPETSDLNIFVNGANISTAIPFGSYTLYNQVTAGNTQLKAQTFSQDKVLTTNFTTIAGQYYSVFLIDSGTNQIKSLVVNDNFGAVNDSIHLRFFNFAHGAPAIDLSYYADSATYITAWKNRGYDSLSPTSATNTFIATHTGTYNFYAVRSGTTDTLARIISKNLTTAGFYTLLLEGKYQPSAGDTTLQMGIRLH